MSFHGEKIFLGTYIKKKKTTFLGTYISPGYVIHITRMQIPKSRCNRPNGFGAGESDLAPGP